MKTIVRMMVAAGFLFAAASCPAEDHAVTVGGGTHMSPEAMFRPKELTIHVGDTVTFTNVPTGVEHNIHAMDGSFRCAEGCDGHGGSGEPSPSAWSDTITFDHVGTVDYQCDPHAAQFGMRGTIHVVDGSETTNVPITDGFSGAWFDPNQSGHGILIEVLPGNQLLAFWFTFSPDGTQQSWFGNVGAIDAATNTATVDALQTKGGRWIPNFDPANVTLPDWGPLVFSFTDCNHGRVDFTSVMPGYGEGHMDLSRLTQPAGLSCP